MFKALLKIFLLLIVITLVFATVFSYEIFSAGQKIFSENETGQNVSIVKQFGEMIFKPSEKLKGEDINRVNILFLGIGGDGHNGGELTDTIMIFSINPQSKEAAILSIPRDLYIEIPETNISNKINAVKLFGDKSKEKNGMELMQKAVTEISGLDIHYYVQLDFKGFTKIIDDLGGIDVYLEKDINDPVYPNFNRGYDPFYISKGWQHLDGATALKVARSRHSVMGDFDRIERQQAIIKATRQKTYEKYEKLDILTLKNMLSNMSYNLKTNVELKEIPRFYKIVKEIKSHNITAAVFDTKTYLNRTHVGLGYTLQAKGGSYEEMKSLSSNIFDIEISEETRELIKKEGASIEIQNGTDSPGLANMVTKDLEELNFRIINSTNIEDPEFSGVKIYDNSKEEKPATLEFLKEKFNPVIEEYLEQTSSQADFVIVLGKGF